jgi:hypothetical protein
MYETRDFRSATNYLEISKTENREMMKPELCPSAKRKILIDKLGLSHSGVVAPALSEPLRLGQEAQLSSTYNCVVKDKRKLLNSCTMAIFDLLN